MLFTPELYYLLMTVVFFFLALLRRPRPRHHYFAALSLALVGLTVSLASIHLEGTLFFAAYRVDLFSQVFKVMLAIGLFLVVFLCTELHGIEERNHPEFYLLLSLCTLAMMMLVSSVELLTIYVALELSSYSLYILVPLRRGYGMQVEAAIKYFLVGAFASAVMLFGIAVLYGALNTTYVNEIVKLLPEVIHRPMAVIGLLLTLCGFFFKLALFPFHFWAPDAYQGAANQVAAYIATASKVAAIGILLRLAAAGGESSFLAHTLVALAVASMTLGNLVAIMQKDMKRLLAYSTVAHAGYVLIGILSMNPNGYAGAIFYALAYLVMKFTCFLVVVKVAYDGSDLQIGQLAGLHRRSPLLAMALMVGLFSLGGIPPTVGFTGKFLVFAAAMQKGYFYLVVIGMINVVISLYYYLRIVKAAYLLEPERELPRLSVSVPTRLLTGTLVAAMVVLGIFPRYFYELALTAARTLVIGY